MAECATDSPLEIFKVFDRGTFKEAKLCIVCKKQFTWRKKWERNWNEVTTCSVKCKHRKKEGCVLDADPETHSMKPERKGHRVSRKSKAKNAVRLKICAVCSKQVSLAYRCRWDKSKNWRFVCRPCWPQISGQSYLEEAAPGLLAANLGNPLYQYGGTWKAAVGLNKNETALLEMRQDENQERELGDSETNRTPAIASLVVEQAPTQELHQQNSTPEEHVSGTPKEPEERFVSTVTTEEPAKLTKAQQKKLKKKQLYEATKRNEQ